MLLAVAEFPTFWPRRRFSVLVVSELGYYFSERRFGALAHDLCHLIEPGGVLLACHWLGSSPDHRTTGAQVHGHLDRSPELRPRARAQVPNPGREAGCEIKVWSRR